MGIKGRRKRERERQEKKDAMGGSDAGSGDEQQFFVFGDGPFQPPAGGPPKLSKSQQYRMQDEDYLEGIKLEHQNRKKSHLGGGEKKRRRMEELQEIQEHEAEALLQHNFNEDTIHEVSSSSTGDAHRKNIAVGARFEHPLVGIDPLLVDALKCAGFMRMTRIQERVIPLAQQGYDILGQAKTGSGKTLAFCIPILHTAVPLLQKAPKSCVALLLAPTKELCVQTHLVLKSVCQHFPSSTLHVSCELITGGTSVAEERRKLVAGVNIVVGTPGRVNDHVKHCPGWKLFQIRFLVLDEADRMLADGFQRDLDHIIGATPKSRQTFLFSATNSKSVQELARLSLSKSPLFVDTKADAPRFISDAEDSTSMGAPPYPVIADVEEDDATATDDGAAKGEGAAGEDIPSSLNQFCCIVPSENRLRALYLFVKRVAKTSKAMVFCSTVASTIFHCQMMGSVGFHDEVLMLHGHMKHRQRLSTFEAFNEWPTGVLFCTDVAARGLDIPNVSWILQYDPPLDPTEYVHRIGRTARAGNCGNALLFLTPEESQFVSYLSKFGIHMEKYPLPELPRIQEKLEHVLQLDPIVAKSAVIAYRAHVGAYQSHILKETFDVRKLDLEELSKAFALTSAPNVTLPKGPMEERKQEYVKGKLKSLNRRKSEAKRHYEQMKTKQQWGDDGSFVGILKPTNRVGS